MPTQLQQTEMDVFVQLAAALKRHGVDIDVNTDVRNLLGKWGNLREREGMMFVKASHFAKTLGLES